MVASLATNVMELIIFGRIAFLTRREMILFSEWFTKVTSTWVAVVAAVSDGSSPLMVPSAVVRCPLTQPYGLEIKTKTTSDLEQ